MLARMQALLEQTRALLERTLVSLERTLVLLEVLPQALLMVPEQVRLPVLRILGRRQDDRLHRGLAALPFFFVRRF